MIKINRIKLSYLFIISIIFIGVLACNHSLKEDKNSCSIKDRKLEIKTYQVKDGWGFDIFLDEKKYIRQPSIPVIKSNIPFKNEEDAKKVAETMKYKICNNIIPPSINMKELDSLKIKIY